MRRSTPTPTRSEPVPKAAPSARVVALSPRTDDDASFVSELAQQDRRAVAALFDRYAGLVRGTLARVLGSTVDLDDLTQDTFITVVRRVRTLRDPSALRSFVVSVAVRIARNELRKRAIRRFIGLEDAASLPVVRPHDASLVEGVRHVYDALDRLGADGRLAFVLRHVEGYELTEVAAACGCSLATIKRRLARAEARFEAIALNDPTLRDFLHSARSGP